MPAAYRADHVGSLLRPSPIHEARTALREGRQGPDELRAVEDQAILEALERQRAAGLEVFTDGEFRRTGFQNDLIESVEGFVETDTPAVVRVWQGPGGEPSEQGTRQVVGGKLTRVRSLTGHQREFPAGPRSRAGQDDIAQPQPVPRHQFPTRGVRPVLSHPI